MEQFPVSLDTLITFVRAIHPEGDPLAHLSDAVRVSSRIDEQADSLVGHFVDQARRSGASWNQIGESMGVTKQAAQKRFVARASDLVPGGAERMFSRFAERARKSLAAARVIAASNAAASSESGTGVAAGTAAGSAAAAAAAAGSATGTTAATDAPADSRATTPVEPRHIVAGLLTQSRGIAALAIGRVGVAHEVILAALGLPADAGAEVDPEAPSASADPDAVRSVAFDDDSKQLIARSLDVALHYGHNYIGTEHLLLSAAAEGPTAAPLAELGLDVAPLKATIETLLEEHIARVRAAEPDARP